MKGTLNATTEYDGISAHAIDTLERRLEISMTLTSSVAFDTSDDDIENDVAIADQNDAPGAKVGNEMHNFFLLYGWFMGEVSQINLDAEDANSSV